LARPGSQKLGANWVEVTVWERMKMRFNQRRNDLKTWPATLVDFISASNDEHAMVSRSALLSGFWESSRGRPAIHGDFRLSIADCRSTKQGLDR
jgi:hypothetical protein